MCVVCVVVGCRGWGGCGELGWVWGGYYVFMGVGGGSYVLHVQCVRMVEPYKIDYLLNGCGIDKLLGARIAVRLCPGGAVFVIGRFCMVRTNQTVDIDTQFAL